MSKLPPKKPPRERNVRTMGDHQRYISRITKTLYYGRFPRTDGLSLPVTELAAELFSEAQHGKSLKRLHCDEAAQLSRKACISPCSLVLAVLYLERLKKSNPEYLEKTAPSDLFLVSLMVSSKFLYDDGEIDEVFINEWARSGGVSAKDLVHLERNFLAAIDWEVYVNEPTFWMKLTEIEGSLARKQGTTRGFFTYTELKNLLNTIELHSLIQCVAAMSAILIAAYTAAIFTLVGSVFIVSQIPGSAIHSKAISDNHQDLPILPPTSNKSNFTSTLEVGNSAKIDVKPLDVLKTGIFLVSIEGFLKPYCSDYRLNSSLADYSHHGGDVENVSWDWWNVPLMKWLAETSKFTSFKMPSFDFNYVGHYLETYVTKVKHMELEEDHIHKATKTRIQDQIEGSWHKEWIDTIQHGIYHLANNIKA